MWVIQATRIIVGFLSSIVLPNQTIGKTSNTPPTMMDRFTVPENDCLSTHHHRRRMKTKRAIRTDAPRKCFIADPTSGFPLASPPDRLGSGRCCRGTWRPVPPPPGRGLVSTKGRDGRTDPRVDSGSPSGDLCIESDAQRMCGGKRFLPAPEPNTLESREHRSGS